jgi:hypothetical protein
MNTCPGCRALVCLKLKHEYFSQATINYYPVSAITGKLLKNPFAKIEQFKKLLIKQKLTFTEKHNPDNSRTFIYY